MTEEAQGSENDITFTEDQQKFVDKRIGQARISAREKAEAKAQLSQDQAAEQAEQTRLEGEKEWQKLAKHHEARADELEPLEAQLKAALEVVEGILKDRIKALGDDAKKAVAGLPGTLSASDKLIWLNTNEGLFTTDDKKVLGTPAKKVKRPGTTSERPEGLRKLRL